MFRNGAVVLAAILASGVLPATALAAEPPNFVPEMTLSYTDPITGERVECGAGCRRFEVPAGVDLSVRIRILNDGGEAGADGVPWDLWFDQRRRPFFGIDLAECRDPESNRLDIQCWRSLIDRVEWDDWSGVIADRVCVPEETSACDDVTVRVPMNAHYEGSRGRGVYSIAVWVDRFRVRAESNEFDNFAGPVRVKVAPVSAPAPVPAPVADTPVENGLVTPSSPRPYTAMVLTKEKETGFSLTSARSRGVLEFDPLYAGKVKVAVIPSGAYESLHLEIVKPATGEVLAEATGRGTLRLDGRIDAAILKDDGRLEAVVTMAPGARGSRGTSTASYPARVVYRRTE